MTLLTQQGTAQTVPVEVLVQLRNYRMESCLLRGAHNAPHLLVRVGVYTILDIISLDLQR